MLKKLTLFAILSIGYFIPLKAQVVHKPDELFGVMKRSGLNYQPAELYIDIDQKNYSKLLNDSSLYHEDSDGHFLVKRIAVLPEAEAEWKLGEKSFLEDKNYKEAKKHYKNVLDVQNDYYPAKIRIGEAFDIEQDYEKSEAAYKQAISKNYVNYLPHYLIAKAYYAERNYEDAVNEISLAAILNRNDTRIQELMNEIYADAHLKYDDWVFSPQYKVFKGSKETDIKVLSKEGWSGYAIGKAIWQFEPGYAVNQGEKPGVTSALEEKECLQYLLYALNDDSKTKPADKAILSLQKVQEFKMMDGFIYYDVLLRQNPALVYQLPNNVIKTMKNYVIYAHGGAKPNK